MARTGRPSDPIEVKRKRGTLRADRTPNAGALAVVAPLAPSRFDEPDVAAAVESAVEIAPWLATTDGPQVLVLRDAVLDYEALRKAGASAKELRDARAELTAMLRELGFNPTARAKMGLAEVKTKSAFAKLLDGDS